MNRNATFGLVFTLLLTACGSSIEGVYSGQDTGFLDQIEIKDDQASSSSNETGSSGSSDRSKGSSSIVGSRYSFGPRGEQMIMEFVDRNIVSMTVDGETESLEYDTDGDEVVITNPAGEEMVLVKRGDDLEGGPDGMVMVFRKIN